MRHKRRQIKDHGAEAAQFRGRAWLGLLITALALAVLAGRFYFLQVHSHKDFLARSEQNRVKPRPIVPARGLIYDRKGRLIADNVPAYRLEVVPEQVKDIDALLAELGTVLP